MPSFGKLFQNMNDLIKLAKDEDFQKFLKHPKVQILMRNPEFQQGVKEKNVFKLMANPEFSEILKDPEIKSALEGMRNKFDRPS